MQHLKKHFKLKPILLEVLEHWNTYIYFNDFVNSLEIILKSLVGLFDITHLFNFKNLKIKII